MAGQFLQQYGYIIVTAAVAIVMVVLGLLFKNSSVLDAGLITMGGSAGLHVGANTNAIPLNAADVQDYANKTGLQLPKL